MDILLHLGAHRCASTTLQSYLWSNRQVLAKRGLTCWTPRRTRDGLLRGMMRHPALITVDDERNAIRSTGRLRVEFDRLQRSGQDALLMSEENILGTMRNNLLDTRLYPLLGERLMRFQPALAGRRLRIGLCVRSYEDYWTSCLGNLIARGGALPTVDTLDFLTTQPRRWRHVVRDIATAFPAAQIIVWPFERMAGQPDAQLRALWGGNCNGLADSAHWRNRSPDLTRLNQVIALRGEHPIDDGLCDAGARWMPFDEDQRNVLRAEYRRDLAWLMAGAEGMAQFTDGRPRPAPDQARSQHHDTNQGQKMPVTQPDRADVTRTSVSDAVLFGGRHNGIEEGLGRSGAS